MLRFLKSCHERFIYKLIVTPFMAKVVRFGVSFDPKLLEKFDRLIRKKGYRNRSEAIRDITREYVAKEKQENIVGISYLGEV